MEMTPEERAHADNVAAQIAFGEILRVIIGSAFYTPDRDEFNRRMSILEDGAVSGITDRKHFSGAVDDPAEIYIKEAASGWVSRLFASITHPTVE